MAVIIGACSAGIFSSIGLFVSYYLSKQKDYESKRIDSALEHLERQIEELYGPLLGLLRNSYLIFEVSTKILPMLDDLSYDFKNFTEEDYKRYDYFTETYFLPINAKIAELINTKITLIEKQNMPESFKKFLNHQIEYECIHNLMKEGKKYKESDFPLSIRDYPVDFMKDVEIQLEKYTNTYQKYLNDKIKI